MKTLILYVFFLISLLYTWAKESVSTKDLPNQVIKKYPVFFPVKEPQSIKNINNNGQLKANNIQSGYELLYLIYDESGKEVKRSTQDPRAEGISDSLPAGKYSAFLIASAIGTKVNGYAINDRQADALPYDSAYINFDTSPAERVASGDLLYTAFEFNVPAAAVHQPVQLKRVAGQLQVDIANRKDFEYVNVSVNISGRNFLLKDGRAEGDWIITQSSDQPIYLYNFDEPVTVHITAYKDGKGFIEKSVENVRVDANLRTVLKGRLSDQPGSPDSFTVIEGGRWGKTDEF